MSSQQGQAGVQSFRKHRLLPPGQACGTVSLFQATGPTAPTGPIISVLQRPGHFLAALKPSASAQDCSSDLPEERREKVK